MFSDRGAQLTRLDIHTMGVKKGAAYLQSAYGIKIERGTGADVNKLFVIFTKKAFNGVNKFEISSWSFASTTKFDIVNETANFTPPTFGFGQRKITWTPAPPANNAGPFYLSPGSGTNLDNLNPPIDLSNANNFGNAGTTLSCTDTRNATWSSNQKDPSKVVFEYHSTDYK